MWRVRVERVGARLLVTVGKGTVQVRGSFFILQGRRDSRRPTRPTPSRGSALIVAERSERTHATTTTTGTGFWNYYYSPRTPFFSFFIFLVPTPFFFLVKAGSPPRLSARRGVKRGRQMLFARPPARVSEFDQHMPYVHTTNYYRLPPTVVWLSASHRRRPSHAAPVPVNENSLGDPKHFFFSFSSPRSRSASGRGDTPC